MNGAWRKDPSPRSRSNDHVGIDKPHPVDVRDRRRANASSSGGCDVVSSSSPPSGVSPPVRVPSDAACTQCAPLAENPSNPSAVVVDGSSVYWLDKGAIDGAGSMGGSVIKAPIGGGQTTALDSGLDSPFELVADDTTLYWLTPGTTASPSGAIDRSVHLPRGATWEHRRPQCRSDRRSGFLPRNTV